MAVQKMMLCIELVNITFKQGKLGWNEMYLQVVDKVEWISWGNKRPMGPIAYMRKQFKSINTYGYIITLIKRKKNQGCFVPSLVEIGSVVLEKIFLISSMYFCYFLIISPWKRAGPFIWRNLNSLHPRILCRPILVKIGSVVLEKKIFKFCQCIFAIS